MEIFIVYPANKEQSRALKVFMRALKINFDVIKDEYSPEFVEKIEKSRQEIKEGKGVKIKVEDIWRQNVIE